jgi:putative hydrolase of HD superfamily
MDRLQKQLDFIVEVDKMKHIYRQNFIADGSRRENDAEHSWHLAIMSIILSEHVKEASIDVLKVVKMVIIHDIVEIDAGDTFLYDVTHNLDKEEREEQSAKRIFGLLPSDQHEELQSLWQEFEARESLEAKYAAAIDGLHPLINNYITKGAGWIKHGVKAEDVIRKKLYIKSSAPLLWDYAHSLIIKSKEKGYLL